MVLISRFRSWWQRASKPLAAAIIIVLVLVGLIVLIYVGYGFTWPETGFGPQISEPKQHAKTLWDWMQLLFVPAILTLGGLWFSTRQNHDLQIAADNQSETALQAYLGKMSELLLGGNLVTSPEDHVIRKIARAQTLTVLYNLDPKRKGIVLQFLCESGLINKPSPVIVLSPSISEPRSRFGQPVTNLSRISLQGADLHKTSLSGTNLQNADLRQTQLSNIDLIRADLHGANLHGANLHGADLHGADLREADLHGADLREADLHEADLQGANLQGANLQGANLNAANLHAANLHAANLHAATNTTTRQLKKAKSLQGATIPDGSTHPK